MTMPLFNDFFPSSVLAFTSRRPVDFTLRDGRTALNKKQKEYLRSELETDLPAPALIRQVHGHAIIDAGQRRDRLLKKADGLMTKEPLLPLVVRTADCLPVFLFDAHREGIGLLHAGWRGAREQIAPQAVRLMCSRWETKPADIKIVLGPAIRPCCYEVGKEFCAYFPVDVSLKGTKYYLDLPKAVSDQLIALGVPKDNIHDCQICTCCDKNYFIDNPFHGKPSHVQTYAHINAFLPECWL